MGDPHAIRTSRDGGWGGGGGGDPHAIRTSRGGGWGREPQFLFSLHWYSTVHSTAEGSGVEFESGVSYYL